MHMWSWLLDSGNLEQFKTGGQVYLNCSRRERQLLRTRSQRGRQGPIDICGVVASVTHIGT